MNVCAHTHVCSTITYFVVISEIYTDSNLSRVGRHFFKRLNNMEELQGKVSTQKSLLELDCSNLYGLNFCLEHN